MLRLACASGDLAKTHHQYFDIVLAMEVIEHVNQPRRFIADLCQLVKVGGGTWMGPAV